MGIYVFARKAFKSKIKSNLVYIATVAISLVIVFNVINISYNEVIYDTIGDGVEYIYEAPVVSNGPMNSNMESGQISYSILQKQNLFFLLTVSAFFAVYCNIKSIKRKSKEIAFILSNGCSLTDVARFLLYVNGMSYLYGAIIGISVGVMTIPLFSMLMYKVLGISGPLFSISAEGIGIVAAYIILQILLLTMLNSGISYRNEVIDLLKVERSITFKDSRNVRTPGFIFLLLFLVPLIITLNGTGYVGVEEATLIGNIVGTMGLYGVIKYFIPRVIDKLKNTNFMYKGNRRIYICNFIYTLKSSVLYLLGMCVSVNMFTYYMAEYKDFKGMQSNSLFCLIGSSIIFACTYIYNLVGDTSDKMYLYMQLKRLSFDKNDIKDIIIKENIMNYALGIFLPIFLLILSLINYVSDGLYGLGLAFVTGSVVIIPIIIGGIVSTIVNKNIIMRNLYGDNQTVLQTE